MKVEEPRAPYRPLCDKTLDDALAEVDFMLPPGVDDKTRTLAAGAIYSAWQARETADRLVAAINDLAAEIGSAEESR